MKARQRRGLARLKNILFLFFASPLRHPLDELVRLLQGLLYESDIDVHKHMKSVNRWQVIISFAQLNFNAPL